MFEHWTSSKLWIFLKISFFLDECSQKKSRKMFEHLDPPRSYFSYFFWKHEMQSEIQKKCCEVIFLFFPQKSRKSLSTWKLFFLHFQSFSETTRMPEKMFEHTGSPRRSVQKFGGQVVPKKTLQVTRFLKTISDLGDHTFEEVQVSERRANFAWSARESWVKAYERRSRQQLARAWPKVGFLFGSPFPAPLVLLFNSLF